MSKILSQEEIDSLLNAAVVRSDLADDRSSDGHEDVDGCPIYNFRRPDRVTKEQIRSLHFLHDRFARNAAASLSAYLRTVVDLGIMSVEQFTYSEFLMSLPDPTAYYAIAMAPLDALAGLELNPNVAFTLIDRMLGGSGKNANVNRAFTEIEQHIIDGVIKLLLENLTDTWSGIAEIEFRISGRETRPQMLQVAAPNEVVLLLGFDIKVADVRGMLNICVPAAAIEASGAQFTQTFQRTQRAPTAEERWHLFHNLGTIPLDITAEIETRMTARELLELGRGEVFSLGCSAHQPLEVQVAGTPKFTGAPAVQAGNVALRLQPLAGLQ